MLSTEGVVDKLSLYLSLKDNEDERIQIELSVFYVLHFLVFVLVFVLGWHIEWYFEKTNILIGGSRGIEKMIMTLNDTDT